MRVFPYAALLTSAVLATSAAANPCYDRLDMLSNPSATADLEDTGHQDLGNGVVLSRHSGMDGHTNTVSSRFRMEFCQSGRSVDVIYKGSCYGENNPFCDHAELDGEGSFEADPAPIQAAIVEMNTSAQVYSWKEFTQSLEGLGARLQDPVLSEFESCACAVFYPELLGNKRPNRVRDSQ